MKLVFAFSLVGLAVAAAQPGIKTYLEKNRQALDLSDFDARLLDWKDRQIILLGESHGIVVNEDLDLALLRYLHREAGVRVYLAEWGYSAGLALNEYLEKGNEAALDFVMRESRGSVSWTKERRAFWTRLRQWNDSLAKEQRVRIVGVDVEHQQRLAHASLAGMARGVKGAPAEAIAGTLGKLAQAGADQGLAAELAASIEAHRAEYESLLGERFFDFDMVARNWKRAVEYYAERDSAKSYAIREEAMFDNFRRLYARLGGGRWYGRWGSFHVLQRASETRQRFADLLNRPDSPVRGKVLSILTMYRGGEALMMPGYRTNPVGGGDPVQPFAAAAAGSLTLFRLGGADSPFRSKMAGWESAPAEMAQYLLLVDKATAQHTLESLELPPVVVRTTPEAGSRNVPADLTEVRVTFSREMRDGTWSWCTAERFEAPRLSNVRYDADRRTIIANAKLEPAKTYAIWLNKGENCLRFLDAQGTPAVPYLLSFETAPAK